MDRYGREISQDSGVRRRSLALPDGAAPVSAPLVRVGRPAARPWITLSLVAAVRSAARPGAGRERQLETAAALGPSLNGNASRLPGWRLHSIGFRPMPRCVDRLLPTADPTRRCPGRRHHAASGIAELQHRPQSAGRRPVPRHAAGERAHAGERRLSVRLDRARHLPGHEHRAVREGLRGLRRAGARGAGGQVSVNQWRLGDPARVRTIRYSVTETWDSPLDHPIYKMCGTSIETDQVLINPHAVIGYPEGLQAAPVRLRLAYPAAWRVGTALKRGPGRRLRRRQLRSAGGLADPARPADQGPDWW